MTDELVKECYIPAWKNVTTIGLQLLVSMMKLMGLNRDIPFNRSWTVLGLYTEAEKQLELREEDKFVQAVQYVADNTFTEGVDTTNKQVALLAKALLKWRTEK